MKRAWMLLAVFAAACGSDVKDSPELAARKADCRRLEEHLFRLSPQSKLDGLSEPDQRKRIDQLMAGVPVEDIAQCAAADPAAIACMQNAADVAAVRACIPAIKS
jgi:hypothetical protein